MLSNRTDDVHRGDEVEFQAPPKPPARSTSGVDWPVYHYDLAHTGYLPARIGPPFKERWVFSGHVLMEFPPIIADGSLYFMRNNGGIYRLDADTGKVKWKNADRQAVRLLARLLAATACSSPRCRGRSPR